MYMERIEVPAAELTAVKRRPLALKLVVGLLFLPLAAAIMVPWTIILAAWVAVAVLAKNLARGAVQLRDVLVYAGETVVGR